MNALPIEILATFIPPGENHLKKKIAELLKQKNAVVVVIDDDPTGAQYAGVPLLTEWTEQSILQELERGTALFFMLTNGRSHPVKVAVEINKQIGANVKRAFAQAGKEYIIISRSDSTLRGHYPQEVNALAEGLQVTGFLTGIIPAFFEAGRYTLNDVQYVQEGEQLVPAHQTPFAKDKAFGYTAENLKQWVAEKTGGKIPAQEVASFGINELRRQEHLVEKLEALPPNTTFIVNAIDPADLQFFASAYLHANVPIIFRTGPSFVAALGGYHSSSLIPPFTIINHDATTGGLIVVGSYVPKSSKQLEQLLQCNIEAIELNVGEIVESAATGISNQYVKQVDDLLRRRKNVVVYTSRVLIYGTSAAENLHIGNQVSAFLVQLVKQLGVRPCYLVAKGGITSHDIAARALNIKRAVIMGQLSKGIPVWETGSESLFPGMPYVVFPGNVGDENALADLYRALSPVMVENQVL